MFTWITRLGFAGILSCLALLLSLFFTTGVASAHRVDSLGLRTPTVVPSSSPVPILQVTPTVGPPSPQNITLVCSSGCDYRLQAVLDSIGVGPSSYLTLNFSVTNTSSGSCEMSFSTLTLQDENNNSQYTQPEGPGIGDHGVILPPNNPIQVSPYFPQAPLQGLLVLQVVLRVACPPGSHQVDLIWYQMETVMYNV